MSRSDQAKGKTKTHEDNRNTDHSVLTISGGLTTGDNSWAQKAYAHEARDVARGDQINVSKLTKRPTNPANSKILRQGRGLEACPSL
ncbi:hypothetical protein TorRG33x02_225800 [Trema orientale]|uniref:Uncharacterized protein n=1 Tax=Trema orientale TaxID=63057 RepID=A0A2P5E7X1_TREOI|nr:hypothetical protein TorRG33x02_225800 [Trema orientale]